MTTHFLGHRFIVSPTSPIPPRFRFRDGVLTLTPAEREGLKNGDEQTFKKLTAELMDLTRAGEGEA